MSELIKFDRLAGVLCYYAKTNASYGNLQLCKKTHVRRIEPRFLKRLSACVREIAWLTWPYYGELQAITSGGAWTNRNNPDDWHQKGQAYDLGGLHWAGKKWDYVLSLIDMAKQYHRGTPPMVDYLTYIAVESLLRKHFGTVLGIHFNRKHWNHFHIDPGTDVGYWEKGFGEDTRVTYVQVAMTTVWGVDCGKIDGDAGPKTKVALHNLLHKIDIGPLGNNVNWLHFLTLTAHKALHQADGNYYGD
jgi:hypothetical protein